jgi:hypothetical protein
MLFAHRASFVNSPALDNRNQEPEHKIARNKRKFIVSHYLLLVCVIRFAARIILPRWIVASEFVVARGRSLTGTADVLPAVVLAPASGKAAKTNGLRA